MADISQNTTLVAYANPSNVIDGTSNAAILVGNALYYDGTYWYPAGAGGNSNQSGFLGIGVALNSTPGAFQPVKVWKSGSINLGGAVLTVGQTYVVSASGGLTPNGKIAPITDLGTSNYVTILGVANTTSNLVSPPGGCLASGSQHA